MQARYEAVGTVAFTKEKGKVIATVDPSGKQAPESFFWPKSAAPHESLNPSRLYQLEFCEDTIKASESDYDRVITTLIRIREGSRVICDLSICPLHGKAMKRELESVVYGGDYPDSYFDLEGNSKKFPHDGKTYLLCGSGIRQLVWKCPDCHRLSEEWKKRHRMSD